MSGQDLTRLIIFCLKVVLGWKDEPTVNIIIQKFEILFSRENIFK